MKVEDWNGHSIRFVERSGEWWAVAKDVAEALGFPQANDMTKYLDADEVDKFRIQCDRIKNPTTCGVRKTQDVQIMSESGIYHAIFHSYKEEAKAFRRWVCDIIKELRKSLGLSEYEAFRLMDKEQQKAAMRKLNESLREPAKVDYIKANVIADKAVSVMHGYPKMVGKAEMDEAMLRDREAVLADVVDLMAADGRFALGVSVSGAVYRKYCTPPVGRTA